MKKISLLLAVFLVLFAFSACEEDKDDQVEPEKKITVEDLKGDWEFVSLEFEGETYTGCDPELKREYYYAILNLYDVTEIEMTLFNDCVDVGDDNWSITPSYKLKDNIIEINDDSYKFKILNYDDFNGNILKLKFISSKLSNVPLNGIYTLEKQ